MPLDNIKTRMQSTGAESRYKNSFDCLRLIIRDEGVSRLWGGTTPRLARLMVSYYDEDAAHYQLSGGIVFTVYEKLITAITEG
jgi:solute carrier family 25 citrate transporter 1